jgi:hypothetical protein
MAIIQNRFQENPIRQTTYNHKKFSSASGARMVDISEIDNNGNSAVYGIAKMKTGSTSYRA